jgi:hypothetical protein
MSETPPISPKAFISYSWSSVAHQEWVLTLATRLREDGVDVSLDKWDLKEGHDALAFMERMVSDPSVTKVIVVSDMRAPNPNGILIGLRSYFKFKIKMNSRRWLTPSTKSKWACLVLVLIGPRTP